MAPGGGWTVDPTALAALRLSKAADAYQSGDVEQALVEAEELLDDHPEHLDALYLVGDASLRQGDAPVADAAFSHYLTLAPGNADALAGLAAARFELADLAGTIAAAGEAAAVEPELAEAWYYIGLALERLDRPVEAREAHARATELAPTSYPPVDECDDATWQIALAAGRGLLPDVLSAWLADVPVLTERFPVIATLASMTPPLSPMVWCLYDGTPPEPGAGADDVKPTAMRIYKGNLERVAAIEGDLPRRIAEALRHEVLDWINLGPDELPLRDETD
jgi:tetratricopeptide (TPR) repeat protein